MFSLIWFLARPFWPLLILVLLVNAVVPEASYENLQQEAEAAAEAGQYGQARRAYEELLDGHPHNIEYHRGYLRNHFRVPKRTGRHTTRDDKAPRNRYERLAASGDARLADIGRYGLGFYHVQEDRYEAALEWYLKINRQDQPFVNNSVGHVLMQLGRLDDAEARFLRELEIDGNRSGAWSNLSRIYDERSDFDSIERLLGDPAAAEHVSSRLARKIHYVRGHWVDYLVIALRPSGYSVVGVAVSLLITAAWFVWLRKLDVYEPEDVRHKLAVLGGAFLLTETAAPLLYDFYAFTLGFDLEGGALSDLLFSIFGIGLIEESIKIVPVLIVIKFSKIIDESVDYVVYASVAALGFALAENIGYLSPAGLDNIFGRAVSATVAHMALSTFAVSGYLYVKFSPYFGREGSPGILSIAVTRPLIPPSESRLKFLSYLYVSLGFAAACLLHGVYDFFLVTDGFWGELAIASFLVLVLKINLYNKMIRNALNRSEFYDAKRGRSVQMFAYITRSFLVILSAQYGLMAAYHGPTLANYDLLATVMFSWFLMAFLLASLGVFEIEKGEWYSPI